MLKSWVVAAFVVAMGWNAFGQMTPDEAMEKLRDKQAAATTQPADPLQEIAELKAVIATQAKQIDDLKAKIRDLQSEVSLAQADAAHSHTAAASGPPATRLQKGMSEQDAVRLLGQPAYHDTNADGEDRLVWERHALDGMKNIPEGPGIHLDNSVVETITATFQDGALIDFLDQHGQ